MKSYSSMVLDSYITKISLDKALAAMVREGYQLIPTTLRGNVLVFERDATIDEQPVNEVKHES